MLKNFDEGKIDFVGKIRFFAGVSVVLSVVSIGLLLFKGLNYGIDFSGGTEIQIKFQQPISGDEELRKFMTDLGLENVHLQRFGENNEYLIRFEAFKGANEEERNRYQNEVVKKITDGLKTKFATQGPEIRRVDSVGPQIGDQMKRNGILALFYALIAILIYVGLRFDYEYAPGAVLCLFHDALMTVGVFSLVGKEVTAQLLAAVLTIVGYSMNDTIIVYDRIRETSHTFKGASLKQIINRATNDTIHRTILTSSTVMISCLALYFLAGGVIEEFAFAMLIGVVVGTYSSIYVASPLIILFEEISTKRKVARAS
jgi:preprotein translocase subunit SecF